VPDRMFVKPYDTLLLGFSGLAILSIGFFDRYFGMREMQWLGYKSSILLFATVFDDAYFAITAAIDCHGHNSNLWWAN